MNEKLAHLISEYQWYVSSVINLLKKSRIPLPKSASDWAEMCIPAISNIDVGVKFIKHGYGCTVLFPNKKIDFDFGKNGEIDGFDLYRLIQFSENNLDFFGFESKEDIEINFNIAKSKGSIFYSGYILYYIKDSVHHLSDEVLKIINNNHLPHVSIDSINRLYASCYLSADLMRKNYLKIGDKFEKNRFLNVNDEVNFRIYFLTWIGYLKETSEGFEKLNIRKIIIQKRPDYFYELIPIFDSLNRIYSKIRKSIVKLRNDVFHFKKNNESIDDFLNEKEILDHCNNLHESIEKFFSLYRILCEVHYIKNNRMNESQMDRKSISSKYYLK